MNEERPSRGHPALTIVGALYWSALYGFSFAIKDPYIRTSWTDGLVAASFLFAFGYTPAIASWMIARSQPSGGHRTLVWVVGFVATLVLPAFELGAFNKVHGLFIGERGWQSYFGGFAILGHLLVLYGGAVVIFLVLPWVQRRERRAILAKPKAKYARIGSEGKSHS